MMKKKNPKFEIDLFSTKEALVVNTLEYRKAVEHLLQLESIKCGGSHRAAAVLLSLYNGAVFKVDLADVCGALDSSYLKAVLIAIAGRHQLLMEPHTVIANGQQRFEKLAMEYLPLRRSL